MPRKVFSIVNSLPVALAPSAKRRASLLGVETTSCVPVAEV